MSSAAENFLRQKRDQQRNGAMLDITVIAPSPSRRLGMDEMGGYNMKSGMYTGNGPDNMTQRQVPTQRRIDANGKPYYVDENEVVVVDSETLNDYGGPEALNQFIQQNRPGRQFYRGGIPTSQGYTGGIGSGTSIPISQSNGMAQGQSGYRQYACGGVPTKQYYNGGIPTDRRSYAISPEQKEMLSEINGFTRKYQSGGVPTDILIGGDQQKNTPAPEKVTSPFDDFKNSQNKKFDKVNIKNNTLNPFQKTQEPVKVEPIKLGTPEIKLPNQQNITAIPNVPIQGTVIPNQLTTPDITVPIEGQTITPVQQGTDQVQETQTQVPTKPPVYSPSDYDEMIANRYLGRMGAQQEAQRAGEAQRGMQAGLSEREVMGRGAIGDVGRREAMAGATSDFAIDAARRAEEKDKWQQQFDLQQGAFELKKNSEALQTALNAGDFDTASQIFSNAFGKNIDFTKAESIQNANIALPIIDSFIESIGPNGDPEVLATLGALKGVFVSSIFDSIGVNTNTGIITNPDGSTVDINDIIGSINSGNLNNDQTQIVVNIGKNAQEWLDNTIEGELFKGALTSSQEGSDLISKMESGDLAAAQEYGALVTSFLAQSTKKYPLTDGQKNLLKKYGMYDKQGDLTTPDIDILQPKIDDIKDKIKSGDSSGAKAIYNSLTDQEKELIGSFDDISSEIEDYNKKLTTIKTGSYEEVLENFPKSKDDQLYKDLLDDESTTDGIGSKKEHTGSGNNQYYFEKLGNKMSGLKVQKGDIVNIGGTLLVFYECVLDTKSGSDNNIYYFIDPITGDKKSIKAAKGKTGLQDGWQKPN